jgi:hypothetical protein
MKRGIGLFLAYVSVLAVSTLGVIALKEGITGTSGPNTHTLAMAVFAPLGLLLLGARQGRRIFLIHLALLAAGIGFVYLTYPASAPMNFQRQVTYHLGAPLVVLYLAGFIASLSKTDPVATSL